MLATTRNRIFHILLIEDNAQDEELLRRSFSKNKDASPFELTYTANELETGLHILDSQKVDLVLLDLSLPDSSGIETFRRVHWRAPHLPVVVLSGNDEQEISLQTLHEGAQEYLIKGRFDHQLLLRALHYARERKQIEETLAQERNLLRSLLDNIPDYIYAKDLEGRYTIDNVAHYRQLGAKTMENVVGKTVFDFFPEEIALEYHTYDQAIMLSGQPLLNHIEPGHSVDGRPRWLSTTKIPVRNASGNITGLVCIGRDITEQKLAEEGLIKANEALARNKEELLKTLEELKNANNELRSVQLQLIEAEKMKSIGRLAAGVAHEVKNPLAIVTMGVEYLTQATTKMDESIPQVLSDISEAVKRADEVIKGLLDFSAPKRLDMIEVDLNAIIEQALMLVRGEMKGDTIEVRKDLQTGLPHMKLDPVKIGQVFVNLFTNAIHAMSDTGGILGVRTYAKQLTGVGPNVGDSPTGPLRVGETVAVAEIEDSGHGIPEDKLKKVFDPFFTTKPTGKGTGLGLTVTKTIIDLHGGTIEIANKPDHGVRVTVMFGI